MKQSVPIVKIPSLRVIFSRLVQPENAEPLIDVTDAGISIAARFLQLAKASVPIVFTVSGMVISLIPLQPSNK